MKKKLIVLLTLISLFTISCSNSDETSDNTLPVVDNYKLLSVSSEGKILEIGNNTGDIKIIGQIKNQFNLIQLSSICNVSSKIYAIEASYVPSPNILLIYDKSTGVTTTHQIIFPTSIATTMADPFITNIEYNGSELIAIVSENQPNNSRPNKIISINLQNYETTDLNINFYQRSLTSTELISDKLYVSTRNEGLIKIDLTQKIVTELKDNGAQINATRLAKISSTKLCIMKLGIPQYINGVKPFEYNLETNLLSDKSSGDVFAVGNITGGSKFHNEEYLNFVFNTDSKFGILKINYTNNERKFVALDRDIVSANTIIIDIIE